MTTAVSPRHRTTAIAGDTDGPSPADALVIFGITGDLAKVMTFHSLYRLEQRGLIDCPIVGVAANDWTVDQLRQHARKCIEDCGEKVGLNGVDNGRTTRSSIGSRRDCHMWPATSRTTTRTRASRHR